MLTCFIFITNWQLKFILNIIIIRSSARRCKWVPIVSNSWRGCFINSGRNGWQSSDITKKIRMGNKTLILLLKQRMFLFQFVQPKFLSCTCIYRVTKVHAKTPIHQLPSRYDGEMAWRAYSPLITYLDITLLFPYKNKSECQHNKGA